jgi:ribonucleoside-triphosphate reductase (thioredoxin)
MKETQTSAGESISPTLRQPRVDLGAKILSDLKFYNGYSRYNPYLERKETWEESVMRVMDMHRYNPMFKSFFSNPQFVEYFEYATQAYKDKLVLASQRTLQFGGDQILKHNARLYNCLTSYCDRPEFFQECLYWLLCGCGVGFSVQFQHVNKLPSIIKRTKGTKTFQVPDSVEGWADAIGVLTSSYFVSGATFPDFQGYEIKFDFSLIRPEGAMISGGFKAPGPEGLRRSLIKIEELLEKQISQELIVELTPIICYDIVMHLSDAVLSGGVRRSATICLFSATDTEMMKAKTGNWFYENPQRARSNNSVLLIRDKTSREDFAEIMKSVKQFGEPGFIFSESEDIIYNPCVEIGMRPQTEDGRSGWQGCNLTEINGSKCNTKDDFLRACKASAILGTLQAAYTNFKYVNPVSKEIFDREALLGCSITGFTNNPKILFDKDILIEGAELIKQINKEVSTIIGINQAARTTCVKPSGNASVLLETASGIHGEHSEMYFRIMQLNKNEEIAQYLFENYPALLEESVWSANKNDFVVYIPVKPKKGSIYKEQLLGVKQLEYVKLVQQSWVEAGTNVELCVDPKTRHNVSNTITVNNWDEVEEYIYQNKALFAGISLIPYSGDKIYAQAPFTAVLTPEQIFEKYNTATLFASGLIVDALHYFDTNLWQACDHVQRRELPLEGTRTQVLLKKDWIRRAKQFAKRYFSNNLEEMTYCLKDIHLYHKWLSVNRSIKGLDVSKIVLKPKFTDIDTLGAISCSGPGGCEVTTI